MGLSCNSLNGSISAFLYLVMYCMITLSFFCVLINIEHIKKGYNMTYLNQLYSVFLYNKEIAFHIIIIIFVMAAIPPFSSFFAKFFIFIVSIETKLELITALLLFFTLISTFYYLNFIQQLIFFKINDLKIFYFKENILYYTFLRLNSFIFSFAFLKLTNIYDFVFIIITSCL
jgi:NADH-quinone oxidoreductase subunit N